ISFFMLPFFAAAFWALYFFLFHDLLISYQDSFCPLPDKPQYIDFRREAPRKARLTHEHTKRIKN
ncbi:MAG: hypothetical protein LBR85_08010, partial [Oscillospiraceae bacterium]|nr:hypothetical protein [Oscillospiraceae bacterium]